MPGVTVPAPRGRHRSSTTGPAPAARTRGVPACTPSSDPDLRTPPHQENPPPINRAPPVWYSLAGEGVLYPLTGSWCWMPGRVLGGESPPSMWGKKKA